MPQVTVRELVGLVARVHPRPPPVDETLRRAGIADIGDRRVDRFGGVWFAVSATLQKVGQVLPTYQIIKIGTNVISACSVPLTAVAIILAWLAGFVALATLSVRSTVKKI
jgi:hypothetical protein